MSTKKVCQTDPNDNQFMICKIDKTFMDENNQLQQTSEEERVPVNQMHNRMQPINIMQDMNIDFQFEPMESFGFRNFFENSAFEDRAGRSRNFNRERRHRNAPRQPHHIPSRTSQPPTTQTQKTKRKPERFQGYDNNTIYEL